eukprot:scaffold1661_cov251-Pinguiococcus_pyrenoidosus.AAC.20
MMIGMFSISRIFRTSRTSGIPSPRLGEARRACHCRGRMRTYAQPLLEEKRDNLGRANTQRDSSNRILSFGLRLACGNHTIAPACPKRITPPDARFHASKAGRTTCVRLAIAPGGSCVFPLTRPGSTQSISR